MTKQELFNKMWAGFEKQGWRHARGEDGCQYLSASGCKCAIGHLIPDGHSGQSFPFDLDSLVMHCPDLGMIFGVAENLSFLRHAQRSHDQSGEGPDALHDSFIALARFYNLTIPEAP